MADSMIVFLRSRQGFRMGSTGFEPRLLHIRRTTRNEIDSSMNFFATAWSSRPAFPGRTNSSPAGPAEEPVTRQSTCRRRGRLQRRVRRRTCDRSETPQHDGPEQRLLLESIGLVETTGSKIRDLEEATELVSELVLGDDGDGKLGLFGGTERQN
jgi:hypothetical protein